MMESNTVGGVVLITGTSSGIGRRLVETFARTEHRVFAGMREPDGKNAAAKAELEALAQGEGLAIEVVALDVTDDAQVEAAVAHVLERTGRIDVLVNNAGLTLIGLSECSSLEQVRRLFEVNYFGPLRLCRAVLPSMRKRRSGLVVHMSSIGGRATMPNSAYYCATKTGLEALGESQRYELASFGVDVVLVEPGAFGTEIFDNAMVPDDRERAAEYGPLAHKGEQGVAIAKQMIADQKLDAQEVADEVLRLARLPVGQRPLRTLVGEGAKMLEPINAVTGPLAEAMFKAFGFI
jgi:NAD(P)-dependent dehydrogenase (short-subunit alcohol dehydrogenase family)